MTPAPAWVAYCCRRCGRPLFESDAAWGRVRLRCWRRDCGRRQVHYLGGYQRRPRAGRPAPAA